MGFKIKKPKISVPSISRIVNTAVNPVQAVAPNVIKLPSIINPNPITATKSLGNTVSDFGKSVERSAKVNWQNLGKGDIGKSVKASVTDIHNQGVLVPKILTGKYKKEDGQKALGGYLSMFNIGSYGVGSSIGGNSGIEKITDSKFNDKYGFGYANDWFGMNKGISTLSGKGKISSEHTADIWRYFGKSAAIVGGVWAGSALAGGSSAGEGGAAAGDIFAGSGPTAEAGVLTPAAYGSSGTAGTSVGAGLSGGGAAAAAGSSWWSTGIKTAETLGITRLLTSRIAGSGQPGGVGSSPFLIPGENSYFPVDFGGGGSSFSLPDLSDETKKTLVWGGLAIASLLILRAVRS